MRRALPLAVAVALALVPAGNLAAQEPPADWLLVKITAGPGGASGISFVVGGYGTFDGSPTIYGTGMGGNRIEPWMYVGGASGGSLDVRTTKDLGGHRVVVRESDGTAGAHYWFGERVTIGELAPGEVVAFLKFHAGLSFAGGFEIEAPTVESGDVAQEISQGPGSRSLQVVDPADTGTAVGAGSAAAGFSTHEEAAPAGIAGGIAYNCWIPCWGTWRAPDGAEGAWRWPWFQGAPAPLPSSGDMLFAGPAGTWTWALTGITMPSDRPTTSYAGWAPVGSAWTLFRAARAQT